MNDTLRAYLDAHPDKVTHDELELTNGKIFDRYSAPVRGKDGGAPDLSEVHKRGGEYIPEELEAAMSDETLVAVMDAAFASRRLGNERRATIRFFLPKRTRTVPEHGTGSSL